MQYPDNSLDPYVENDRLPGVNGYSCHGTSSSKMYPRKASLTYHTHMSDHTHTNSHTHITDHPLPLYNPKVYQYSDTNQRHYSTTSEDEQPCRSVSPQIHRMGHLALYSRDIDDNASVHNSQSLLKDDDVECDHTSLHSSH